MRSMAIVLALCVACAGVPAKPATLVDPAKWVESEELPAHPKSLSLPAGQDAESEKMVVPIEEGMCDPASGQPYQGRCPEFSGIAVSEARASRDALYRIQYEELRTRYVADRNVWEAHRSLYETQIQRDWAHIKTLQPTWWEQHDGQVLGICGFAIGSALMLGLVKAVAKETQ